MIYITMKQSPSYHQMTLEEFLFQPDYVPPVISQDTTSTRTYEAWYVSSRIANKLGFNIGGLIGILNSFNEQHKSLFEMDRHELYNNFYQEKKGKGMGMVFKNVFKTQKKYVQCDTGAVCSGIAKILTPLLHKHPAKQHKEIFDDCESSLKDFLGQHGFDTSVIDLQEIISPAYRRIDAPVDELQAALYQLKTIFDNDFRALYHTSAYAYIHGRSTLDAVKKHQANESKWFYKGDLKNFFNNTTLEFIMRMFSMIYPFSEVVRYGGKKALETAIGLAMLDGGLPQGTKISPTITNIMMIPIDYTLTKTLRKMKFVNIRYADDFIISSKYHFDYKDVEKVITDTLASFNAPFTLNESKSRYGSSAGSNWNLGVMLNKDNEITVGYKDKRKFQAMLASYVMDKQNGRPWDIEDVRVLEGYRTYYKMVEGETIDRIVDHVGNKFGVSIPHLIKQDLRVT